MPSVKVVRELATRLGVSEEWLRQESHPLTDGQIEEILRNASIAVRLDDVDVAETLFREVIEADRSLETVTRARAGLAEIDFRRGQYEEAACRLENTFASCPECADFEAAITLGRSYARLGRFDAASDLFRHWLDEAISRNDPTNVLRFGVLLTNAQIDNGELQEATALLRSILAKTEGGDPMRLARVYWSQARAHVDDPSAEVTTDGFARKASGLLQASEHAYYRATASRLLAHSEIDAGRTGEALNLLRRGREILGDSASAYDIAEFELDEARALAAAGEPHQAVELAKRAADVLCGEMRPLDVGRCYAELAQAFDETGDHETADRLFELAIETLQKRDEPNALLIEVYKLYGKHLEQCEGPQQALSLYERAMSDLFSRATGSPARVSA
jgi:tetratricopeptide (TPR) repeat protein